MGALVLTLATTTPCRASEGGCSSSPIFGYVFLAFFVVALVVSVIGALLFRRGRGLPPWMARLMSRVARRSGR